jgi:hypothetical protein
VRSLLQTRHLFVVVVVLGLFTLAVRNATDPDLWWHLRTGQLFIQTHKLFHVDPYSFTRAGQLWVDHEWLSQILIFGLYRVAGWAGLITGFAAIIACAFLVLFLRCPGRPYVAGVLTVWGGVASVPSWGVRPQMFTLLLACMFLLILEQSYERPKLLYWLLPLMLLWVNLHAGYAVGIALLAVFLLGDALDRAFGGRVVQSPVRLRRLALILFVCIAIVPLNPYGPAMYSYPLKTLHSRAMSAYIGEWLSPDFHQPRYLPVLLMMLATMLLPVLSPRHLSARELLLLVVTTYAALRSVRHIPIYVLVAAPLLSAVVQATLQKTGKARLFDRPQPLTRFKLVVNGTLLAAFMVFSAVRVQYVIHRQPEAEAKEFPAAAAAFLMSAQPPAPLMNHYNWGGYFIWKIYPEYKVYIDGRADVYGDSFMDEFASAYYLKGEWWRGALEKWRPQTIALPPDAPLVTALKTVPGWKPVFLDRQAIVLTRDGQR